MTKAQTNLETSRYKSNATSFGPIEMEVIDGNLYFDEEEAKNAKVAKYTEYTDVIEHPLGNVEITLKGDLAGEAPKNEYDYDVITNLIKSRYGQAKAFVSPSENPIDTTPDDDDKYRPASWFTQHTEITSSRLRQAAQDHRITKRVRTKMVDKAKLYNIDDAERWWPGDMTKKKDALVCALRRK